MEFIYFIILFAWIWLIIGFYFKDPIPALLASMLIMAIGVYLIINGILVTKDWITEAFGVIHIAVGGYVFVKGTYELVNG